MPVFVERILVCLLCAAVLCWGACYPAAAAEPAAAQADAPAAVPPDEAAADTAEGASPGTPDGTLGGPPDETPDEAPDETPDGETPADTPAGYRVTLHDRTIGAGEALGYTTISSSFAGGQIPEGYYPGPLTVELTGTVVVEAGGELAIGKLSLGDPSSSSPILTGTGQIIVKAGGSLRLAEATLVGSGAQPLIVQEYGGSVELSWTEAESGLIAWSSPLVNNAWNAPDDLWLEAGTALTEAMLPAAMQADLQVQGREETVELPLCWDLAGYSGQTDGAVTLTGSFLDPADGTVLPSLVPLTITVHWYTPGALIVTDAVWKGDDLQVIQLTVQELPEDALIWGEVSYDGGLTWSRWEDEAVFWITAAEPEGHICNFKVSDETPGLFRVVAEDPWADEYTCWRSDAFALSPPEDNEDSGGNRGGSTTPHVPDREPEPEPLPEEEEAVTEETVSEPEQPEEAPRDEAYYIAPTGNVEEPDALEAESESSAVPEDWVPLPMEELTPPEAEPEEAPAERAEPVQAPAEPEPESAPSLSRPEQYLLAGAGLAVCAGVAALVTVRFRKSS